MRHVNLNTTCSDLLDVKLGRRQCLDCFLENLNGGLVQCGFRIVFSLDDQLSIANARFVVAIRRPDQSPAAQLEVLRGKEKWRVFRIVEQ